MSKITDKRRYVNTRFWNDNWVVEELDPLERYLFMYLLTNSRTNIAGVYEISLRQIAFETGIEKDNLIKMIDRLGSRVKYIDGYIVLKNSDKHQDIENPKIKSGIDNILKSIDENTLSKVLEYRLSIGYTYSMDRLSYSDSDSDSDSKKDGVFPETIKQQAQELHEALGHDTTIRSKEHYKKLKARLDTFTFDELKAVATKINQSEWHVLQGHNNLTTMLQNDTYIEKWLIKKEENHYEPRPL